MKRVAWMICITVFGTMLVTGCGADKPEDVAKTFAKALSNADIEEAKEVSTEKTQRGIDRLVYLCNKPYLKKLADEALKVFDTIDQNNAIVKTIVEKKMNTPDIKEFFDQMMKKYKKPEEISSEVMKSIENKFTKPLIDDFFSELKIKTEHPEKMKYILTKYYADLGNLQRRWVNKRSSIYKILREGDFASNKNVTPECVAKHTEYDFIDSINFIETKNMSADEAQVKLELVDNKDKSKKVFVYLEKVKGEWKVSRLMLLNDW